MSSNDRYDLVRDVKPGDIVCGRWSSTPFFVVGVEYRRYVDGERVKTSCAEAEVVVMTAVDSQGILVMYLAASGEAVTRGWTTIVRAERE